MFSCALCNYISKRKFDLKRHQTARHNEIALNITYEEKDMKIEEKDMKNEENNMKNEEKDMKNEENNLFNCCKCNKKYKTKKYLINHEKTCNGLNILTCPKCMKTFSSYGNKSAHIKNNNCKAKSIIHSINEDVKHNLYINGNNNNNNTTIINNYGSERTDYITVDDMVKIFKHSGDNVVPRYIEFKHFNKNFPENHNIKYEKNNNCLIKRNGEWKITNLNNLSNKLIQKNSHEIFKYYRNKTEEIDNKIKHVDLMEYISKRFDYIDLCLPITKNVYNQIKYEIKDIIKTSQIV